MKDNLTITIDKDENSHFGLTQPQIKTLNAFAEKCGGASVARCRIYSDGDLIAGFDNLTECVEIDRRGKIIWEG